MIVRFLGADNYEPRISQGVKSLKVGSEYAVLEIFSQADGANKFRIEFSERELPPLFDSRMFEIVSAYIPNGWCVTREYDGSLTIGPQEWSRQGFWEAFMDNENWAVELYKIGRAQSIGRTGRI